MIDIPCLVQNRPGGGLVVGAAVRFFFGWGVMFDWIFTLKNG